MTQKFYTRLTEIGQAKYANAKGVGSQIEFTQLAVGDANGQQLTPDQVQDQESMVNERRIGPINQVYKDADNPNWLVMEQVLPPEIGGWTIREVGIYDTDGDLVAYGNYPETYKPILEEGSSRTSTVRFVLMVSDTSVITLKVDPSVVLATREYVDQERAEHEASRNHPGATESAQGMVRFATTPEHKAGLRGDRATHPAGVLALLHTFGIGNSIKLASTDDLDDVTEEGIYSWSGGSPFNAPGTDGYGVMLVIDDGQPCQIILGGSGTQFYQRRRNSGVWPATWVNHRNASILNVGTLSPERLPGATTNAIGGVEKATELEALSAAAGKYPDSALMRKAIDAGAAYQNIAVFSSPGTTSWPVPQDLQDGRRKAHVTVVGGGGGGAKDSDYGTGGSAAGAALRSIDLSGVASVDVTVGAGGAGATTDSTKGSAGASSSFGTYCSAEPGGGGQLVNSPTQPGDGVGGDINLKGGWGTHSIKSGAGSTIGGYGGESFFGGSGAGGSSGRPAGAPGAGGGGSSNGAGEGGNGADGIVIVEW